MNLLALLLVVSLQGTVTRPGSNEPVVKATVELKRADGGDLRVRTALTGSGGEFAFNDVPAAGYLLTVSRAGFVKAAYGERRPEGPGTPIRISDTLSTVRMTLTPAAVITGRITDRQGQPLGNATVDAMKMSYAGGKEHLTSVQSTITNDLGEYRLFYLTPGKYYVGATPTVDLRGVGSNGNDSATQFRIQREQTAAQAQPSDELGIPIYFPGTPDMPAAAAIELKPGGEARSIDFVAAPVRSRHIRGVVVNAQTGQAVAGVVSIRLARLTGSSYRSSPTSTFDLPLVMPGSYFVGATSGTMSGSVPVEVFDRDVDNVTIPVSNTFNVSGRVIIEGATADNPGPDMKTLRIVTRSEPNDGAQIDTATPDPEGVFTLKNVPLGTFRISVAPALQNAYLKSIRFGNSEGLVTGITLQGPPPGVLQVVIDARAGKLDGKVLNDKQQPLPNTVVVLAPETELRTRTELFKTVTSTAAGDFKLTGIPPGNYRLFSWEDVETGSWLSQDFLRNYEERGITIKVSEGSSQKIDIHTLAPQ